MPRLKHLRISRGMISRIAADAAMIQLSLICALAIRLLYAIAFESDGRGNNPQGLFWSYAEFYLGGCWLLGLVCLVICYVSGFYTYGQYYLGRYKILVVIQAVTQSYLVFGFLAYFLGNTIYFPRAALLLAWVLSMAILVGSRVWSRFWTDIAQREFANRKNSQNDGPPRVLVVGGAGFIGSALLPQLLERGYRVRLLDLMVYGEEPISAVIDHPNLEVIRGDFRQVETVARAVQDVDSVVHLGAIVGDPACNLDEDLTIDVNLSATKMVAELAKLAGVRRFVFASTCSVYGACDEILDERSRVKPISLYGHTKVASEKVLWDLSEDHFAVTILRFATIYGLSGRMRFDLVVNVLAAKAKTEGRITITGGDQWRPLVHVEDAAHAVVHVIDAPASVVAQQVYNVGSNAQNYQIKQIGEMVKEVVISTEMVVDEDNTDNRSYHVDFSKIHNQLAFEPKWTVERGIEQVLEAIASGDVEDYTDPKHNNVKFLSDQGSNQLTGNDWARELIKTMQQQ